MLAYLSQDLGISARPYTLEIESKGPSCWNLTIYDKSRELSQGLTVQ